MTPPPPTSIDGTDITGATIDGQDVQEITVDGDTVFSAVVDNPPSVVTQYRFEDNSNTSVAIDFEGNNNATVNGATFNSTNPRCDSFALQTDGVDDNVRSNSSVDLVNNGGPGASVGGFFKPDGPDGVACSYGFDGDNELAVEISGGNWAVRSQAGGGTFNRATGPSISNSSYQHVLGVYDGSDIILLVDGVEEARTSSVDLSNIGPGTLVVAERPKGSVPYDGLSDNATFATSELTPTDQDTLMQQC